MFTTCFGTVLPFSGTLAHSSYGCQKDHNQCKKLINCNKKLLNFKFEVMVNWNERYSCLYGKHTDTRALLPSYAERNNNVLKNDLFLRSDEKEFSQLRQTGRNISPDFHQRSETEIPKLRVM